MKFAATVTRSPSAATIRTFPISPPRARMGIFGVTFGAHQPLHALANAHNVVGENEQSVAMIAFGMIVGRNK